MCPLFVNPTVTGVAMHRLALALLMLGALIAPTPSHAQSAADSAAIRSAALDYVEGFYEGDSTRHVRSIRPDVYKYGFWLPRDSTRYQGERMTWPEFHAYTARMKAAGRKTPATAPKDVKLLDAQDQTAAVKVTAWWGTDYLLLGKYDGQWMISHVLWQSPPRRTP
jgi:hypothetical protein